MSPPRNSVYRPRPFLGIDVVSVVVAFAVVAVVAVGCSASEDSAPATAAGADAGFVAQFGGNDAPTGGGDRGGDVDGDLASDDSAGSGYDAAGAADGGVGGEGDTSDAGPPVNEDCPGAFGCSCVGNDDCDTGLCFESPTGKVCAKACLEECPAGMVCASLPQGADVVQACVSRWARLCSPCAANSECNGPGITSARCVARDDGSAACGSACGDDGDCPLGYGCAAVKDLNGGGAQQCVAVAANGTPTTCSCSPNAVALGLQSVCSASVEIAGVKLVCGGIASCQVAGDAPICAAAAPSAEVCDGVDNDCNGTVDDGACDDKKACTKDSCDIAAGCVHIALGTGSACDADGSVCTVNDTCKDGTCIAGVQLGCDDGNPCTQDSCDLAAGCTQVVFDGVPCTDDNPCTLGDVCKSGACAAGVVKTCTSPDQCLAAACDVATGACVYPKLPAGQPCDDASACTSNDVCKDGFCSGGVIACDDGNPCTDDSCAPAVGCQTQANSAGCNDGNACTGNDVCALGVCGGSAIICDDNNACTSDTCDNAKGCVAQAVVDESPCGVGGSAWCVGGNCTSKKAAGEACNVAGSCASGYCADGICCDGACSGGCESCLAKDTGSVDGQCKPIVAGSDPDNACIAMEASTCGFTGQCDGKGACAKYAIGTPCTDAVCGANGTLQAAGVCGISGCKKPSLVACDDGDACTIGDGCADGACTKGSKKSCDDGNACTDDSCDAKKGCVFGANNAPCSDGNVCTLNDACGAGSCVSGAGKNCDDGVACSLDTCSGGSCSHNKAGCCSPTAVKFDFNTGSAGWTFSNSAGPSKGWQVVPSAPVSTSPPGALYYGDPSVWNFDFGASSGTAISPSISVPAGQASSLSMSLYLDIEMGSSYDQITVSIVAGGTKKVVFTKTTAGIAYKQWLNVKTDTTSYGGSAIQLEIVFNTIDSILNSTLGVVIDDVALTVTCPN